MPARIRWATSPKPVPAGRADKSGVRSGPLRIPNLSRWGLGRAAEISTGAVPPGLADGSHRGRLWLRRRGKQGQGYAERTLGNGRLPGAVRLGLFPARAAVLPAGADPAAGGRVQAARHPRRLPRLGYRDHRGAGRGAYQDRQADLLHLGRQRVPGRRARTAFRIGAALSLLRARQGIARAAQHRACDRAAVRRRESRRLPPHRASPRLHHAAAGGNAAGSRLGFRRGGLEHRQDRRHLRPSQHLEEAEGRRQRQPVRPHARGDGRRRRSRAGVRELRRFRHALWPPPRCRRLCGGARSLRPPPAGARSQAAPGRPSAGHRRSRLRPDPARHRSHARARTGAVLRARRAGRSARQAAQLRRHGPDHRPAPGACRRSHTAGTASHDSRVASGPRMDT